MSNILIVGVNSFLSKSLIGYLKKDKRNTIVGVYNIKKDKLDSDIDNFSIKELLSLENDFDVVYLVSAYIPNGDVDKQRLYEVNVSLVEIISSHFVKAKMVMCSTVSVYQPSLNINENSALGPINEYAISKLWGEQIVKNHPRYAIVRISSMYGIGMNTGTFIPRLMRQAIYDREIKVFGDGSRLQNYVHVSEVVKVLIEASQQNDNDVYLANGVRSYSNLEVANYVKDLIPNTKVTLEKEDNILSYSYNDSYTRNKLNLPERETLFEKELKNIIEWLKES